MDAVDSRALVAGIDFGTLSGPVVVVRLSDGAELGSAAHKHRAPTSIGSGPMTIAAGIADVVAGLRLKVAMLHAHLPRNQLVVWTAGNVSARVPGQELLVIKPSGVSYEDLSAEAMVVSDLDGNLVDGDRSPSSDTAAQAYVYKHMPEVGGVVHTHSASATAWAAHGEPVPCVLTRMADEFGGEIPVGPFSLIGDDSIGRGIVETVRDHRSPAVLIGCPEAS